MKKEKHLETILVLVLALGVVYWKTLNNTFLIVAFFLGLVGVLIPFIAEKIHWAWMKLAHAMGYVMSKVMLTIVYVVFVLPLAFLAKAFGKKNGIVLKPGAKSYFTDRNFTYTKESMENVW